VGGKRGISVPCSKESAKRERSEKTSQHKREKNQRPIEIEKNGEEGKGIPPFLFSSSARKESPGNYRGLKAAEMADKREKKPKPNRLWVEAQAFTRGEEMTRGSKSLRGKRIREEGERATGPFQELGRGPSRGREKKRLRLIT